MMMGSFLYKQKAREALKGNWQNALVVCFFSGLLITIASLLQTKVLEGVMNAAYSLNAMMSGMGSGMTNEQAKQLVELADKYLAEFHKIEPSSWMMLAGSYLVALIASPALALGCRRYFVSRVRGDEIGVREGLLGRFHILLKAMWLYVRIGVQVFLWSLLLIVPGVIAAMRYSMAPYLLADDPSLSVGAALRRSKEMMKGRKAAFFMLNISFVGWSLLITLSLTLLGGMLGKVVLDVAAQFAQVALNTYIAASCAAFYNAYTTENGVADLLNTMRRRMKQAGISDNDIDAAGFGQTDDVLIDENEDADGGDDK